MFSNSAYHSIATGNDSYRSMENSIIGMIKRAITQYIEIINPGFFMNSVLLVILMSILLIYGIYKSNKHKNTKVYRIVNSILILYPTYMK